MIINAAAYTAVDRAEKEPSLAMAINGSAPGVLAEEARAIGAGFIHFSTDYVFDGRKSLGSTDERGGGSPSVRTYAEFDLPHPINVYGSTKWAGEQAVERAGGAYLILRTAWVYGVVWQAVQEKSAAGNQEPSFVTKVLRWAKDSPFRWLEEHAGLYHLAGDGFASRLEWARAILEFDPRKNEQIIQSIVPAQTSDFPAPAALPQLSALDCRKFERTFGFRLPPWRFSFGQALAEISNVPR